MSSGYYQASIREQRARQRRLEQERKRREEERKEEKPNGYANWKNRNAGSGKLNKKNGNSN
jgi:hypothetical protein